MNRKIVADSSSDLNKLTTIDFAIAPMIIHTTAKAYLDDKNLDVSAMVEDLLKNKDRTSSACPGLGDWLNAFGDAEEIFCLTITSKLSGCYNSAILAKEEYESLYPGRRVHVFDTLSTGPEMQILAEKIAELTAEGLDFDAVCAEIEAYSKKTHLVFMLESLKNLANNGRVSHAVAKITGILGIRLVGKALEGVLEPLDKCRGAQKALSTLVSRMKELGYKGGKVRIAHCMNPEGANELVSLLKKEFVVCNADIYTTRGLCSYYAEKGGILVGFES